MSGAAYGWPLRPFDRAHPVRGYFNDPRISGKSRAFHFGVDVVGADDTPVFAVDEGKVHLEGTRSLSVVSPRGGRAFGYWHVVPAVSHHQQVRRHQLLGHIERGWLHVHFAETLGGRYRNPLRPGALGPWLDPTSPRIAGVSFVRAGTRKQLSPLEVSGAVDVIVDAWDKPPVPVPPPWDDVVVTPALVRWRVRKGREVVRPVARAGRLPAHAASAEPLRRGLRLGHEAEQAEQAGPVQLLRRARLEHAPAAQRALQARRFGRRRPGQPGHVDAPLHDRQPALALEENGAVARAFLGRPVFSVGGATFRWGDVLADLAPGGAGPEPPRAEPADAEAEFRYARNLVSAEDTEAWLARWDLTVREWHDWLGGRRDGDGVVDAVCSGALERRARELALEAAARVWAGEQVQLGPGRDCLDRFRDVVCTPEAIDRELGLHVLDWVEVVSDRLTIGDADAASEAALCLIEDGLTPGEVAVRSGARLSEERLVLADVEPALQARLLAAEPGDLVGPLPEGDEHVLRVVRARRPPDVTASLWRDRAADLVFGRACERDLAPRVEWHELA